MDETQIWTQAHGSYPMSSKVMKVTWGSTPYQSWLLHHTSSRMIFGEIPSSPVPQLVKIAPEEHVPYGIPYCDWLHYVTFKFLMTL